MDERPFADSKDIIQKVARRLDLPEEKVAYVFNFLIKYLEKLTWKRGILTIFLPHLGRLYVKKSHLVQQISRLNRQEEKYGLSRLNKIRLSKLREKNKEIETNSEKGSSKLKLHWKRSKLRNFFFTNKKTFEELENWQNNES